MRATKGVLGLALTGSHNRSQVGSASEMDVRGSYIPSSQTTPSSALTTEESATIRRAARIPCIREWCARRIADAGTPHAGVSFTLAHHVGRRIPHAPHALGKDTPLPSAEGWKGYGPAWEPCRRSKRHGVFARQGRSANIQINQLRNLFSL
jgi:hypothetical protein